MAKDLYFRRQSEGGPGLTLGTNTANQAGTNVGWSPGLLAETRGSTQYGAVANTVTGPTNGIEPVESNGPMEFFSLPLSADFTISGTITLNLWAWENSMSANAAINAKIQRVDKTGAIISTIATTARTTEVALTTAAVNNFTVTPTSTNMLKGERIRVVVFFDDAGTMATGFTAEFDYSGPTAGANGDSYIRFNENLTFLTTEPSGTIFYPINSTQTQAPVPVGTGSTIENQLSRTRGSGNVQATYVTAAGWQAPGQAQGAGSNPIEWYSPRLQAFTLSGLVRFNLWSHESISTAEIAIRAEVAVCDADGSNVTVYGAATLQDTASPGGNVGSGTSINCEVTTTSAVVKGWVAGSDISVANGQRLRLRVYADNAGQNPWPGANTFNFTHSGTTGGSNGDSWVQIGQTVTDYTLPSISSHVHRWYEEGSESGSVGRWLEDAGTNVLAGVDTILLLRVQVGVPNAGSADVPAGNYTLQFTKNQQGFGPWTTVASGQDVEPYDSASLTNDEATTQRLLDLSSVPGRTWVAGKVSEDGVIALGAFARNTYTELLFAVKVRGSVLNPHDYLRFYIAFSDNTAILNGAMGYEDMTVRVMENTKSSSRLWLDQQGAPPSSHPEMHRGTNTAGLSGTNLGWWPDSLWPYRSVNALPISTSPTASVNGPTAGIEWLIVSGASHEFISPPLAADVTISGTITLNLWARETGDANASINAYIDRLDSTGAIISRIATTARTTEINQHASTNTVNNFTVTPTSTAMQKGDRIRLVVFFDDATSNMVSGHNLYLGYGGSTASADGDSWVEFTETLDFIFTEPAGSKYYLTDVSLPGVGSNTPLSLLTTRDDGVTNKTVSTVNGWTAPVQLSNGAGGVVEWFTPTLSSFTLDGLVMVRVPGKYSTTSASLRAEIAIVNGDGSNAVVWASGILTGPNGPGAFQGIINSLYLGILTTTERSRASHLRGPATAVSNGQRLRLRVYIDDAQNAAMTSGGLITVYYGATAAEASGDAWIQFSQTLTEGGGPAAITPGGSITAAGTLVRQPQKIWSGSITSSGALARQMQRLFSGSTTASGALTKLRQVAKALSGSITPSSGGAGASYSDDFTRADSLNVANSGAGLGSAWTGDGWRIQSNAAQRPGGNAYTVYDTQVLTADQWAEIDIPTGDPTGDTASVILRSSNNTPAAMDDFYEFLIGNSGTKAWIIKYTNGAFVGFVADVTISADASAGTLRGEAEGTTLRLKWNGVTKASVTDSTHNAGRYTGMGSVDSSNSALAFRSGDLGAVGRGVTFQVNKAFTGSSTPAGALARISNRVRTYTGSITTSGALAKQLSRAFAGSITASGVLVLSRLYLRSYSGSITPSGTLVRSVGKLFAGSVTASSTLARAISKVFSGSTTPTGALARAYNLTRTFSGSITPTGTLLRQMARTFSGSITATGTLLRSIARTFSGSITAAGTLVRSIAKAFAGAITPSGFLDNEFSGGGPEELNVGGTITAAGNLLRQVNKTWSGSTTPAGALANVLSAARAFSGSITSSGAVTFAKTVARAYTGSITPSGALTRTVNKALAGSITGTSALSRYISKVFGGSTSPTGFVNLDTGLSIFVGGTIALSGAVSKAVSKMYSGTLTPSGALFKTLPKVFGGSITPSSTLSTSRVLAITLSGSIQALGVLAKQVEKLFSGTTTPSGTFSKTGSFNLLVGGAITAAGALRRGVSKFFGGSTTPTGVLVANVVDALTGIGSMIVKYTERAKSVMFIERRHNVTLSEQHKTVNNFGREEE